MQTEPIDQTALPRDVFWVTPPAVRSPGRTSYSARTYVSGAQRYGLMRVERPDGVQYARCLLNPRDEWEPHRQR